MSGRFGPGHFAGPRRALTVPSPHHAQQGTDAAPPARSSRGAGFGEGWTCTARSGPPAFPAGYRMRLAPPAVVLALPVAPAAGDDGERMLTTRIMRRFPVVTHSMAAGYFETESHRPLRESRNRREHPEHRSRRPGAGPPPARTNRKARESR